MSEKFGPPPIVFHFQPKGFKILSGPTEIEKWEQMMKEEVGLKADLSNVSGTCTESRSNGTSDDCDQD